MSKKKEIQVNGKSIGQKILHGNDYFNITDIAKSEGIDRPSESIRSWMRSRETMEFLRYWEQNNNPDFRTDELKAIWEEVGLNRFQIRPQHWTEITDAIGMVSKSGRGGGTFAHIDIAIHYANWLNPKFYVHFIGDYRRLKEEEADFKLLDWDLRRELAKANHEIHTDAIREHLSPVLDWNTEREIPLFASEIDMLNRAVFGMTAREFKELKPDFKGNLRDWATEEQLSVLNNMQSLNAGMIEMGLQQDERYQIIYRRSLKEVAVLKANKAFQNLKKESTKKLHKGKKQ